MKSTIKQDAQTAELSVKIAAGIAFTFVVSFALYVTLFH